MQSYYQQRGPPSGDGTTSGSSYPQGYPTAGPLHPATAAAAAAAARMQWSPNVHPGQWTYDFYHHQQQVAAAAAASYHQQQSNSEGQQPATSPTDHSAAATPHNIRDILGVQQQQQAAETLVSEVAKTPSYQKSPTSAAAVAGNIFHYPSPAHQDLRSPTTPNQDHMTAPSFYLPTVAAGRPFGKLLWGKPCHGAMASLACRENSQMLRVWPCMHLRCIPFLSDPPLIPSVIYTLGSPKLL